LVITAAQKDVEGHDSPATLVVLGTGLTGVVHVGVDDWGLDVLVIPPL